MVAPGRQPLNALGGRKIRPGKQFIVERTMFMLSNFLLAIAKLLNFVLSAYIWVIIGRAVISWVNADPYNPIVQFLVRATEPLLARIRRVLPIMGGLDLSPMVLILAVVFLQSFLVPTLQQLAMAIR